jgi:hypothetical protein
MFRQPYFRNQCWGTGIGKILMAVEHLHYRAVSFDRRWRFSRTENVKGIMKNFSIGLLVPTREAAANDECYSIPQGRFCREAARDQQYCDVTPRIAPSDSPVVSVLPAHTMLGMPT